MDSIRMNGRADSHTTLQDYRRQQMEAYLQRNATQLRRQWWADKQARS